MHYSCINNRSSVNSCLYTFQNMKKSSSIDKIFLLLVILITLYGTLMVFSAGTAYAEARYSDTLYFVKRQAVWIVIGLAAMYFASMVETRYYEKYTFHFYLLPLQLPLWLEEWISNLLPSPLCRPP